MTNERAGPIALIVGAILSILVFALHPSHVVEQRYLTGWTGSCYGIALEFRRYELFGSQFDDNVRNSYGIAITLKNVGTIGTH